MKIDNLIESLWHRFPRVLRWSPGEIAKAKSETTTNRIDDALQSNREVREDRAGEEITDEEDPRYG